ncbi:lipase 3 precursor [mine drainage metagenome]|uniref:Lipase 3 n=1 Tax=mine drainage metagenome TaxID=410659 RepID=A0A1J5Q3V6_9ZZZZ
MQCLIDGRAVHVACVAPQAASAAHVVVLVHGAGNDHRAWQPLLHGLGQAGLAVYAPDLPGHGASEGPLLRSVGEMAAWLLAMLDACGIDRCALAGHSMGSLVALHAAGLAPRRISHLALIGTAWPMRVAPALLDLARTQPDTALRNMVMWSYRQRDGQPLCPECAQRTYARMHAVQAGWPAGDLLATDLALCDAYAEAEAAAARIDVPVALILGEHDRMTPVKAAQRLRAAWPQASVTLLDSGHELMEEATEGVRLALLELLARPSGGQV